MRLCCCLLHSCGSPAGQQAIKSTSKAHSICISFSSVHLFICTPLYLFTSIPLYTVSIPPYLFTFIPLYLLASISLYVYTSLPLYLYTSLPLYIYTPILVYLFADSERLGCILYGLFWMKHSWAAKSGFHMFPLAPYCQIRPHLTKWVAICPLWRQ